MFIYLLQHIHLHLKHEHTYIHTYSISMVTFMYNHTSSNPTGNRHHSGEKDQVSWGECFMFEQYSQRIVVFTWVWLVKYVKSNKWPYKETILTLTLKKGDAHVFRPADKLQHRAMILAESGRAVNVSFWLDWEKTARWNLICVEGHRCIEENGLGLWWCLGAHL